MSPIDAAVRYWQNLPFRWGKLKQAAEVRPQGLPLPAVVDPLARNASAPAPATPLGSNAPAPSAGQATPGPPAAAAPTPAPTSATDRSAQAVQRKSAESWLAIGAFFLIGVVFYVAAEALQIAGLVPQTSSTGWIIVLATALVVASKAVFGVMITHKYMLHRQGYEFCTVTLGGTVGAAAVQFTTGRDLYPNLPHVIGDPSTPQNAFIFLMVAGAFVLSVMTTKTSQDIDDGKAIFAPALTIVNLLFGFLSVCGYVALLVGKTG